MDAVILSRYNAAMEADRFQQDRARSVVDHLRQQEVTRARENSLDRVIPKSEAHEISSQRKLEQAVKDALHRQKEVDAAAKEFAAKVAELERAREAAVAKEKLEAAKALEDALEKLAQSIRQEQIAIERAVNLEREAELIRLLKSAVEVSSAEKLAANRAMMERLQESERKAEAERNMKEILKRAIDVVDKLHDGLTGKTLIVEGLKRLIDRI
jgi:hypothetical protein